MKKNFFNISFCRSKIDKFQIYSSTLNFLFFEVHIWHLDSGKSGPDLRSGAQRFCSTEIRGPILLTDVPDR